MKKSILFLALVAALAVAYVYGATIQAQFLGTGPYLASDTHTDLSLSTTWYAIAFMPSVSRTLTGARIMANSAPTGTLATTDLTLEVYSDNGSGKPNASLGGGCTATAADAVPTAAQMVTWSGMSCSLTGGTLYYIVTKNLNGTPASNFWSPRYGSLNVGRPLLGTNAASWAPGYELTYNGTTWTLGSDSFPFYRLDYSGGVYSGNPVTHIAADATNKVYNDGTTNRQATVIFTSPAVQTNVIGVVMYVTPIATPTGTPRFNLYVGSSGTLTQYSTAGIPTGQTIGRWQGYFGSVVNIPANSTVRVGMEDTSSAGTSIKYYQLGLTTVDSDVHSAPLIPFQGTMQTSTCAGTTGAPCTAAANWTQTANQYYGFQVLLDPAGEFTAPGGSSGPGGHPIVGALQWPGRSVSGWLN